MQSYKGESRVPALCRCGSVVSVESRGTKLSSWVFLLTNALFNNVTNSSHNVASKMGMISEQRAANIVKEAAVVLFWVLPAFLEEGVGN